MLNIFLKNITKSYGIEQVLDEVNLEIKTNERIGLIGKNGTGKTTILKIISGVESYDSGEINIAKGITVGYLDQIPNYNESLKVIDIINLAFSNILELKKSMENLELLMANASDDENEKLVNRYGRLQLNFEMLGGYTIQERLNKVCTGLKINDEFKNRLFINLSGGEKTTVILAKILIESPSVLLLDEPTNHLDIESVEWLEKFLNDYSGSVLMISHDRYFLDRCVSKIFEIDNKKVDTYHGNYSYYLSEKQAKLEEVNQQYNIQQRKIIKMEHAIKRFKDWGRRSDNPSMFKKANNMQKRIDKMDKIDKPVMESKKIGLKFYKSERSANKVITVKQLNKSFNSNLILQNINFEVAYGEKIGIIGKNGCGKSTLLKCILGLLEPDSGEIKIGSRIKIGYLDQVISFENEDFTIYDEFIRNYPCEQSKARSILAKFLFYGDDVFKSIKVLSGGEKVRLKLCILIQNDVNLLILDEPTNHLDIDSREMLENALEEFDGTIIFISHDRYFLNKFSDRIAHINNKKLDIYIGNYDYFKEKTYYNEINNELKNRETKNNENYSKSKSNNQMSKNMINRINNLEIEINKIDRIILEIEDEVLEVSCDYNKLKEVLDKKNEYIIKRETMIEEWINLNS